MDPKDLLGTVMVLAGYSELSGEINQAASFLWKVAMRLEDHVDRFLQHNGAEFLWRRLRENLVYYLPATLLGGLWFVIYAPMWLLLGFVGTVALTVLLATVIYLVRLAAVRGIPWRRYISSLRYYEQRAKVQRQNVRLAQANQPTLSLPAAPADLLAPADMDQFGPDGRLTAGAILWWFLPHVNFLASVLIFGGIAGHYYGVGWVPDLLLGLLGLPSILMLLAGRRAVIGVMKSLAADGGEIASAILNNVVVKSFLLFLPGITSENYPKVMPKDITLPAEGIVNSVDIDVIDPFMQGLVLWWAANVAILDIKWASIIIVSFLCLSALLEWVLKRNDIDTKPGRQEGLKVLRSLIIPVIFIGCRATWELIHEPPVAGGVNESIGWLNSFMAMRWYAGLGAIAILMLVAAYFLPNAEQIKSESKPVLRTRYAIGGACGVIMLSIVASMLGAMAHRSTVLPTIAPRDSLTQTQPVIPQASAEAQANAPPSSDDRLAAVDRVLQAPASTPAPPAPAPVPAPPAATRSQATHPSRHVRRTITVAQADRAQECAAAARNPALLEQARSTINPATGRPYCP